ncbi:hypothetical protein BC830DRAFT_1056771 [Chytriomyces sp. MP71]|nr:hypothetical protein BC830DRAFT_1056771 [Chytriomyces sp. MP71]
MRIFSGPGGSVPNDAYSRFKASWRRGEAVVFSGGMDGIHSGWTPEYFIREHGDEESFVVDCVSKSAVKMAVGTFFNYWIKPVPRKAILKLPDWPSHTNFDRHFPNHYADFQRKVPFSDYSGFTGSRNLAARLQQRFLPPDLGPKMYNAFGSSDAGEGGYGTTPIHLDMADAVNVMMYAKDPPTAEKHATHEDVGPTNRPAAVWDIYHRDDLPKLRAFMRREFDLGENSDDPVHDQFHYLNELHRARLYEQYGVRGWRIYQYPGDAVFVPAGCAHQVCNYKDCIKAACDFVSPENLTACVQLTSEFRLLSKSHRRRQDLLALRTILWNVWETCPLFEPDGLGMVAAVTANSMLE